MNVLSGPLASLSPIPQTHTFNKNTNGRRWFMFPKDYAIFYVIVRGEICVTICVCVFIWGKYEVFPNLMNLALQSTAGYA